MFKIAVVIMTTAIFAGMLIADPTGMRGTAAQPMVAAAQPAAPAAPHKGAAVQRTAAAEPVKPAPVRHTATTAKVKVAPAQPQPKRTQIARQPHGKRAHDRVVHSRPLVRLASLSASGA